MLLLLRGEALFDVLRRADPSASSRANERTPRRELAPPVSAPAHMIGNEERQANDE